MSLPTASPPSSPDEEHPEPATTRASRRKPARRKRIKDVNYSAGYLVDDKLSKHELVVVLFAGAFAYDPTLLAVAGSGSMIGVIEEDGTVTFPGISEEFREQLSSNGITIESLEKLQAEV